MHVLAGFAWYSILEASPYKCPEMLCFSFFSLYMVGCMAWSSCLLHCLSCKCFFFVVQVWVQEWRRIPRNLARLSGECRWRRGRLCLHWAGKHWHLLKIDVVASCIQRKQCTQLQCIISSFWCLRTECLYINDSTGVLWARWEATHGVPSFSGKERHHPWTGWIFACVSQWQGAARVH